MCSFGESSKPGDVSASLLIGVATLIGGMLLVAEESSWGWLSIYIGVMSLLPDSPPRRRIRYYD
ncbi:hypothetical protein MishRS11D_46600 (plasmid) [Methylomagnum ishizawai]|nr:hypothetical protein MishRS11D_46600 [Methylomagnum ishizawai]